jgi:acyl carrier protein
MNDVEKRLVKCFETVFSDLPADEVPRASQASVAAWDSVAAIMLVNVIEEEFNFQMDFELLPELDSFERVLRYVETQVPA